MERSLKRKSGPEDLNRINRLVAESGERGRTYIYMVLENFLNQIDKAPLLIQHDNFIKAFGG